MRLWYYRIDNVKKRPFNFTVIIRKVGTYPCSLLHSSHIFPKPHRVTLSHIRGNKQFNAQIIPNMYLKEMIKSHYLEYFTITNIL